MVRFDDGHGMRDFRDGQNLFSDDDLNLDQPTIPVQETGPAKPEYDWSNLRIPPIRRHLHAYQFKINNVNTAIRGCITCGRTWGTIITGEPPYDLRWYPIYEADEPYENENDNSQWERKKD